MYTLAARWTVHAKKLQLADLTVLIKSLVILNPETHPKAILFTKRDDNSVYSLMSRGPW